MMSVGSQVFGWTVVVAGLWLWAGCGSDDPDGNPGKDGGVDVWVEQDTGGLLDTGADADLDLVIPEDTADVVVDPQTLLCQQRCEVADGCPDIDMDRCVTVCLTAAAESCENQCLDMALDCGALALCLGASPVLSEFQVAPYRLEVRGLAGQFIAQTTAGEYSFKDGWTGRDSFFFLTMADGYAYPESLWASNFSFFLLEAPHNVQLFFMDVAGESPDLSAIQEKVEKSLTKLDFAEQCHWRRQIHFVTQSPAQITGWLGEFMQAIGYFAFAVDRHQRARIVGMLQPPQGNGSAQLSYLANEATYFNFEWEREQALKSQSSVEVVMFDGENVGTKTVDVEFPPASEMENIDTLLIDYAALCPQHLDQNCGEWDYLSYMFMCEKPTTDNTWATTACQPKVDAAPEWLEEPGTCTGTPGVPQDEVLGTCAAQAVSCRWDWDCAGEVVAAKELVVALKPKALFEFETPGGAGWNDSVGGGVMENHGAFMSVVDGGRRVLGLNGNDYGVADSVLVDWKGDGFSIGAWVRPVLSVGPGVVWSIHDRNKQDIFEVTRQSSGEWTVEDGASGAPIPVGISTDNGEWVLVVLVADGDTMVLYLDGEVAGTWPVKWLPTLGDRLTVGMEWDGDNGSDYFRGVMDDVVVMDRKLTPTEIQSWAALGLGQVTIPEDACAGYVPPVVVPGACMSVDDCGGYTPIVPKDGKCAGTETACKGDGDCAAGVVCEGEIVDVIVDCVGVVAAKAGVPGVVADTKPCQCERPEGGLTEPGERTFVCVEKTPKVAGACAVSGDPCFIDAECGKGGSCVGAEAATTGYADCDCPCDREIGRWITTYAREGRWVSDHSQFLPLFASGGTKRIRLNSGNAYDFTLKFLLQNRNKQAGAAKELHYLYSGGGYNATYNDKYQPVRVAIPPDAKKVELFAYITGHGFGVEKANCAEFCNHTHHFTVNGQTFSHENLWANDQAGCKKQIGVGTVPNQYGTWPYGRGGWCPGMDVKPFVADITGAVEPGKMATVTYESLYQGAPYVPEPWESPFGGFPGNIVMNSWLVVYR